MMWSERANDWVWVDPPGRTPDGLAQVWLLYQPEPWAFDSDDERRMHLWMRRCSPCVSKLAAEDHLSGILGWPVAFKPYDPLFPELWIYRDHRGFRWLLCPSPVYGAEA